MKKETFHDHGINVSGRGQVKIVCPQCSPTRKPEHQRLKDLSVNIDEGLWKCHHCQWDGFLKDDVQPGFQIKQEKKKYDKPRYKPDPLTDAAISFFSKRGISAATVEALKIGYDKASRSLMFPFIKSGEVINIKYRTQDKKFRQCSNAEKSVYEYDRISDEVTAFFEGEMDVAAAIEAGFEAAIGLPDGAGGYTWFENVEDRLKSVKRIVIWTDNDTPGYQARLEIAKRVGFEKAFFVETPPDCKDCNDVLQKYGKAKVLELIANAKEFPIDGIVYAKDVDLLGYWRHGAKEGISTGLKSLDEFWKFAPEAGELVVGTGYPGSGKTDFMLDLLVKQAKDGRKTGIFCPEEFPLARLMLKCVEKYYDLNAAELCEDQVEEGHHWLHEHFYFQYMEDSTPSVDMICDSIKALSVKKDIRYYLLDPWNEISQDRGSLSETEWINGSLGRLRRICRQYSVTLIILAHPVKPRYEELEKNDSVKPPSSFAISGSAAWRNKADVCFTVHRPYYGRQEESGEVDIIVTKIKDKNYGTLGKIQIQYRYESGTYSDLF